MNLKFTKMQGCGNDFLILDYVNSEPPPFYPREVQFLCDRHFGIGADGLVLLQPGDNNAHARWTYYNSDGSEAEMCGNAARCVVKFLAEKHFPNESPISIQTKAGVIRGRMIEDTPLVEIALFKKDNNHFEYKQKVIKTEHHTFDLCSINTGVPHAVIEVKDIFAYPILSVGKELVKHPAFGDEGTNVTFYQRLVGSRIRSTTFERGVENETFACGTGVAAAAVIFSETYLQPLPVEVVTPGGEMKVDLSPVSEWIVIQGPAEYVFEVEMEGVFSAFEKPFLFSGNRRGR
jgi:diaminopimelate epimerase